MSGDLWLEKLYRGREFHIVREYRKASKFFPNIWNIYVISSNGSSHLVFQEDAAEFEPSFLILDQSGLSDFSNLLDRTTFSNAALDWDQQIRGVESAVCGAFFSRVLWVRTLNMDCRFKDNTWVLLVPGPKQLGILGQIARISMKYFKNWEAEVAERQHS